MMTWFPQGPEKFHYCTTITAEEWKIRLFGPHQVFIFYIAVVVVVDVVVDDVVVAAAAIAFLNHYSN
jgi:hypothetical protein